MSDSDSIVEVAVETVKDRLTNRLYMYIFSSVIVTNWQHILIIFKSKNDIELTLGIMTLEPYFSIFYFVFPVILGVILAILMPYITRFVTDFTAKPYFLIKKSNELGKIAFDMKLAKRQGKLAQLELNKATKEAEIKKIKSNYETLQSQSSHYFKWLQGVLKAYNETGGKIDTPDDLKEILLKLKEHNAVYDLELLPEFKKMVGEIQLMKKSEENGG